MSPDFFDVALTPEVFIFLFGTFMAAIVVGVSGFAFGLVAAAIWNLSLAPRQTTALIVLYALLVQGQAVWRMRNAIVVSRVWPFVLGSAIGIPLGVLVLYALTVAQMRFAVAGLLILFSLYNLTRPAVTRLTLSGKGPDVAVGVVNGILSGATGLAGIAIVIWAALRGWSSNEQRAVFQPAAVAAFLMCLPVFAASGMFTAETLRLFIIGLPCLLVGNALGWFLYGRLNEAAFRRMVLWLLLASGLGMLAISR